MKLRDWVTRQVEGDQGGTRRKVIQDLADRAGVSYATLSPVDRGANLVMYDKALAVSKATGYLVTTIELCDPEPEARLSQIRTPLDAVA